MLGEFFGHWWRASQYVLGGEHIRPAPDAALERYNPWGEFENNAARGRGGRRLPRPYLSLIDLADEISADWAQSGFRGDPSQTGVLDWCGQHGLLGLFFLEVQQVDLPPKWGFAEPAKPGSRPSIVRRQFIRRPTRWTDRRVATAGLDAVLLPDDQKPLGGLVPREYWEAAWEKPGVLLRDLESGTYRKASLSEALRPSFPSLAESELETYDYPTPTAEEFWRLYAESAYEFIERARSFAAAARAVGRMRPVDHLTEIEQQEIVQATDRLQALASQVSPALYTRNDGTFLLQWVPTSLLASYAMMLLLDAARGWLSTCGNCERVFVSSAGRARFCSPRCRKTSLQRAWRARKAE